MLVFPGYIFAAGTCGTAGKTGTTPFTANSLSYADVDACVNTHAAAGETVILPSGSASWSSTLTITDSIIIYGATEGCPSACDDGTKITSNGSAVLIHVSTAGDKSIDISKLTLDGNGAGQVVWMSNSEQANPLYSLRIHHNEFENATAYAVEWKDGIHMIYGLVDNNKFTNNNYDAKFWGPDVAYPWTTWPGVDYIGSKEYIYFEDNISTGAGDFILTSGHSSRWVYRYNTVDLASNGGKAFDVHGDNRNYGVVAAEIYENTFTNASSIWLVDINGGTGIFFNNAISGSTGPINWEEEYFDSVCEPSARPESLRINNSYAWNNTNDSGIVGAAEVDSGDCLAEGTNFWDDNQQLTSGGVYIDEDNNGTVTKDVASNRNPSSCTEDDVYWETDTDTNGDGYPGVLYRCVTTNNWSKVYEAYTYPHPLRNEAAVAVPANAIQGVTIN